MALPAWFDSRKQQNQRSAEQESKRAKQTGGRRQAGSGSSWRARQDNKTSDFLESIKYTDQERFTLKLDELMELRADALDTGREPRMIIDFNRAGVRLIINFEEIL